MAFCPCGQDCLALAVHGALVLVQWIIRFDTVQHRRLPLLTDEEEGHFLFFSCVRVLGVNLAKVCFAVIHSGITRDSSFCYCTATVDVELAISYSHHKGRSLATLHGPTFEHLNIDSCSYVYASVSLYVCVCVWATSFS